MSIGAYSILRLIEPIRDERLNLGVLAWVPEDGFGCTFVPISERVRLIAGTREDRWVQEKIDWIMEYLRAATGGKEALEHLAKQFTERFVVTAPYPIRTSNLAATLSLLSGRLLVSAAAPRARVTDSQLRTALHDVLQARIAQLADHATFDEPQPVMIGGVRVRPGIRTSVNNHRKLWRLITLRGSSKEERIDRAKSAALDVRKLRGVVDFEPDEHVVVMHVPHGATEAVSDATRWIEDANASVVPIENPAQIGEKIEESLVGAAA